MNLVFAFLCFIVFLTCIIRKRSASPLSIFCLIWTVILFEDYLHLYDLYEVRDGMTYTIIEVGIISFIISYLLSNSIKRKRKVKATRNKYISYHRANLALFFAICICMPYFLTSLISLLSGGSIEQIKLDYYTGSLTNSSYIVNALYNYYARPIIMACAIMWSVAIFSERRDMFFLWSAPIALIISFIATGMRDIMLNLAIYLLMMVIITREASVISKTLLKMLKRNKGITVSVIAFVITLMFVSGGNIIKSIYLYTCACITALDQVLPGYGAYPHTLGYVSLNGFLRPVFETLNAFGVVLPNNYYLADELISIQQYTIKISYGLDYNAFYTMFLDLFLDAGLIGVSLGMFIFGVLSCNVYKNYIHYKDDLHQALYLFVIGLICTSMVRFQFASYSYALSLIYLPFMHQYKKGLSSNVG